MYGDKVTPVVKRPSAFLHDSRQSWLISFNHSTGNFCSGIPGRLSRKIVAVFMNDERTPYDVSDCKAGIIECHPCVPVIGQKRREIAAVKRVQLIGRIIMHAGLVKRRCAVSGFMDMGVDCFKTCFVNLYCNLAVFPGILILKGNVYTASSGCVKEMRSLWQTEKSTM